MGDKLRGDDPLRRAIDEIRLEVDGLFGEEIARLLDESNPRNGGEAPATRMHQAVPTFDGLEVPNFQSPLSNAWDQGGGVNASGPGIPGASPVGPDADDARQRLENLARRLESRLRRSRERTTERGIAPDDSGSLAGPVGRHSAPGSKE